ncbi:MAG: PQQ-binding-like beta-propeller repeat protein [Verrucomicrobiales bacterium]|nr:PQQ-binding-like beta-propeller repeat protein [Verrucomicrobiales bacterium]
MRSLFTGPVIQQFGTFTHPMNEFRFAFRQLLKNPGFTAMAALTFALLFAAASLAHADDWPQWRGPKRNGIATEAGFSTSWRADGPKHLWRKSVGAGYASVVISQGLLFTAGNSNETDTVVCLDAETGQQRWAFSYPSPTNRDGNRWGPGAAPTVDGTAVYALSLGGDLFCFEAASGKVLWSNNVPKAVGAKAPRWGLSSAPVVHENLLLVNSGPAGGAFDKRSGKVVWSSGAGPGGPGPGGYAPAVLFKNGPETAAAIFSALALIAVQPATGKELWRFPWPTSYGVNAADPIFSGDTVFVSSGYGKGAGLIRFGNGAPSLVWTNTSMINHFNTCVLIDGHIYGFSCQAGLEAEGTLRCIELKTGAVKWTQAGVGIGTQMAVGNKLVVLTGTGELIVAEATPAGFKSLARAQVLGGRCWTVPVFANGRLYCRNAQGDLVCLDVKGG